MRRTIKQAIIFSLIMHLFIIIVFLSDPELSGFDLFGEVEQQKSQVASNIAAPTIYIDPLDNQHLPTLIVGLSASFTSFLILYIAVKWIFIKLRK